MSPDRDASVDPAAPEEDADYGHAPGDLAGLVDDMEERIIAERAASPATTAHWNHRALELPRAGTTPGPGGPGALITPTGVHRSGRR